MHLSGRLVRADAVLFAQDDAARVDVLVDHEGRHAGHGLPVDHRPVDGRGAAVLRQQGGVEVDGAELRHGPHLLGQHAEGYDDEEVGLPGLQLLQESGILQLEGLQDGDAVRDGVLLDGAFVHAQAPAARLVGDGHGTDDLETVLDEAVQGRDGEFRRAHIDDARLADQVDHPALELAPLVLQRVGTGQGRVIDGLPGQEGADGQQDGRGDEGAFGTADGTVLGQLGPDGIDDVVEDEEEDGNDGRHTQSALAHQGADRGSDEEHDEAGQRFREFPQEFQVRAAQVPHVFIGFPAEGHDLGHHLVGVLGGGTVGGRLAGDVVPFPQTVRMVICLDALDEGGVQLPVLGQDAVAHQLVELLLARGLRDAPQRILLLLELDDVHALDLVAVFGGVGLLEGVILQGDEQLLLREIDLLELQGGVPEAHRVGLLVVHPVV